MDPALAHDEIRIAARWWRELLCRSAPEDRPIPLDRAVRFELALVAEIEAAFDQPVVRWVGSFPMLGSQYRKLVVSGPTPPCEVGRAADFAGLTPALRHLPDGAETSINPGKVLAYACCSARVESIPVPSSSRGGAA